MLCNNGAGGGCKVLERSLRLVRSERRATTRLDVLRSAGLAPTAAALPGLTGRRRRLHVKKFVLKPRGWFHRQRGDSTFVGGTG